MKQLSAPFLEIGLYSHDQSGEESIMTLFDFIATPGPSRLYEVRLLQGDDMKRHKFASINDRVSKEVRCVSYSDVKQVHSDRDAIILQITMPTRDKWPAGDAMIITQNSISQQASKNDNHPISVLFSGDMLSRPALNINKPLKHLAESALFAFKEIIEILKPEYASITVDYNLESPYDLLLDGRTLAFRDCYVSKRVLGKVMTANIIDKYGVYHENALNGTVFISSPWLLPLENKDNIKCDYYSMSVDIGQQIAEYFRKS